jgi:hypothetical protein
LMPFSVMESSIGRLLDDEEPGVCSTRRILLLLYSFSQGVLFGSAQGPGLCTQNKLNMDSSLTPPPSVPPPAEPEGRSTSALSPPWLGRGGAGVERYTRRAELELHREAQAGTSQSMPLPGRQDSRPRRGLGLLLAALGLELEVSVEHVMHDRRGVGRAFAAVVHERHCDHFGVFIRRVADEPGVRRPLPWHA